MIRAKKSPLDNDDLYQMSFPEKMFITIVASLVLIACGGLILHALFVLSGKCS